MATPQAEPLPPTALQRFLVPGPFLSGVALAFAACCWFGYLAAHHNCFDHVERFHQFLSPEALFYPTASQIYEYAKHELPPDKIAVVIGGNSSLYGTGQRSGHVWTTRLQELLGDEYHVVNLGLRGANICEGGAVIAEALLKDRPRMIFITNLMPAQANIPDGKLYRFFFWDAFYKHLLADVPERAAWARQVLAERASDPAFAELRHQMQLDSGLYFNELWSEVAYLYCSTVYTAMLADTFTQPRRVRADPEPGTPPLEERYGRYPHERAITELKGISRVGVRKSELAEWIEDTQSPFWQTFESRQMTSFPVGALRERSLFLVMGTTPYDLDKLTADERSAFRAVSAITKQKLEELGASAMLVCQDYELVNWCDWLHLSESGGARLAEEVAPRVRELADALGYLAK
jgi:hypothetical protein